MSARCARSVPWANKMYTAAPNMVPPAHHMTLGEQHAAQYMMGDPSAPPHLLDTGPAEPNGSRTQTKGSSQLNQGSPDPS